MIHRQGVAADVSRRTLSAAKMAPTDVGGYCPLQIGDHLALEASLVLAWIDACFVEDAFRREVTVRRIL
jgi:hypothetical protein